MTSSDYTTPNAKVCSNCNQILKLSEFYYNAKMGRYFAQCKQCIIEKSAKKRDKKQYRRLNPDDNKIGVVGYIYFVLAEEVDRIKIGFTQKNNSARIKAIKGQSPIDVTLLFIMNGTTRDEIYLHKRFSNYRHHGEWFDFKDELKSYVYDLINSTSKT